MQHVEKSSLQIQEEMSFPNSTNGKTAKTDWKVCYFVENVHQSCERVKSSAKTNESFYIEGKSVCGSDGSQSMWDEYVSGTIAVCMCM